MFSIYFQRHFNTNRPRNEEAIESISVPWQEQLGLNFSLDETQKAVRAMEYRKALGAVCITNP